MSSIGLNKWIVSGHLAADAESKTVDLRSGEKAKVAKATIYVRKLRNREESFTVSLSIWEGSSAWRKLPFLKKGSLIICTGSLEPNPYMSHSDNLPRAGLSMNVLDIDLDNVRSPDDELSETSVQELEMERPLVPTSSGSEAQLCKTVASSNPSTLPSKKLMPQTETELKKVPISSEQDTKPSAKV